MASLGIHTGLELDGGGSTTMVAKNSKKEAILLNRSIHTKIPNRQRPVVNHLLITYQ